MLIICYPDDTGNAVASITNSPTEEVCDHHEALDGKPLNVFSGFICTPLIPNFPLFLGANSGLGPIPDATNDQKLSQGAY